MTLTTSHHECFGDAFLMALSATAGFAISSRRPDDDSIDWTVSCRLPCRPKLDIQMKTWTGDNGSGDAIAYPLKRKNYDDLILSNLMSPRILVLVLVPSDVVKWTALTSTELSLRHCAYWVSLNGKPASGNTQTVTVSLPRTNVFTSDVLKQLMQKANDGKPL